MKEINFFFKSPLFLFPWQLQQSLSQTLLVAMETKKGGI
jgi:hypothetical protein